MSGVIRLIWYWIITFLDYLLDTEEVPSSIKEEQDMGIDKNLGKSILMNNW